MICLMDKMALKGNKDRKVSKDQREILEILVLKEIKAILARQDLKALRETLVKLDLKVQKVMPLLMQILPQSNLRL